MRKIGKYVLLSRIASGTLGDVFLARRQGREPSVEGTDEAQFAVKLLRPDLARDLRFVRLLTTEAPAAIRFEHPAAVRMLEVDREGADVFVVMELERGQPLSAVLKRAQMGGEPLEHRLVCWICAEVAAALHRAHQTPWFSGAHTVMIHGAISPRSVLVTYDGHTKLLGLGFGRARLSAPASSARLPYQAPEILQEKEPTARADTYSLGVLLYDSLSGKHVFRRATDEETRTAIKEARVPPLNPLSLRVNPAIGEMIQRMIAPKIEARYADLVAIETALREAALGAGNAGEELSIALERRMRAIFSGEMRAERRVVQAAQRQPRASSPAGAQSGLHPSDESSGPRNIDPELRALRSRSGASNPPTGPISGEWSADIAPASLVSAVDGEVDDADDPANAVTLSDTPIREALARRGSSMPEPEAYDSSDLERRTDPPNDAAPPTPSRRFKPLTEALVEAGEDPSSQSEEHSAAHSLPVSQPSAPAIDPPIDPATTPMPAAVDPSLEEAPPPPSSPNAGTFASLLEAARNPDTTLPTHEVSPPPITAESKPRNISIPTDRSDMPADTTTVDVGLKRRIARYQAESIMSRSASTVLFRARDPNIGRTVALKVLDPEFVSDPRLRREEWVALFKREARLSGRIAHPLIPSLFDAGRDGNVYFIVYGLVEGEALNSILERGPTLRAERVRGIVIDLASALEHIHSRGLVHCDVRAANVILARDGRANLIDLSMSIEMGGPEHPLLASNLLALAPEYLSGYGYAPRCDQFALGTLLYQMLTGTRPFRGADDRELIRAIEEKSPRPPEAIVPNVDPELSEIAMRLLEKDPALRFESCAAIVRRLEPGAGSVERGTAPPRRPTNDIEKEQDTQPSLMPLKPKKDREAAKVDIVIVDPQLDPAVAADVFSAHGERVSVHADFDRAMRQIERDSPNVVVVAHGAAEDVRTVRRRLADLPFDVEPRIVPELAGRLMGPVVPTEGLAKALAEMYERAGTLSAPIDGGNRGPVSAARVLAKRLGAGPRAELLAPLAVAARELAARLRLSPTSEAITAIVPPEVGLLFADIERVLTEPKGESLPKTSLLSQIVAVVETYFAATFPKDERQRVSPRRALLDLRRQAEGRVRPEVISALVDHLREIISALDLSPGEGDAPRILLAGLAENGSIARAVALEGFAVEEASNGHIAWERLRGEAFAGAIVDRALPGRDALSLLRMCRSHPDTAELPFLIVARPEDRELASEVERAGSAELVEQAAAIESIRARVSRWTERAASRRNGS